MRSCEAACTPVFQVFSPLITQRLPPPCPSLLTRRAVVSMNVASEPCAGSVIPNAKPLPARRQFLGPLRPLLRRPVVEHQQQADVVADDHVLVLQVAMQAKTLAGQVLADHRHAQVRAVPAPVFGGKGVPVMPGGIGQAHHLGQQRLPVPAGQAAAVPVRAGVLAPVIEEPDVVVLPLQRADLPVDELVEFCEVGGQIGRDLEVHVCPSRSPGLTQGKLRQRAGAHP